MIERTYQVGVYIRLSKEDGDDRESESVENQRNIIKNFIEIQKDLEFVEEYVDDGYTGTNFQRPGFQKMIQDIEKERINCVITKDLSRFGRDHVETGYYLEKFLPQTNVRYIAIGDNVDTLKSNGLQFLTFKLSFNDYYSQDISTKIRQVKKNKFQKGEFIGSFAPFGYKKDPDDKNNLIINKETAPVVRKIFRLYLEDKGIPKIVNILNKEEIPTPAKYIKSKQFEHCNFKWNKTTVYRILTNPVYIGTAVGAKTEKVSYKIKTRRTIPKEQRIYVEDRYEPIINKEDFEKVKKKLKDPSKCRDRINFNPLRRFVYCGICGHRAKIKVHNKKVKSGEIHRHQYFICGNNNEDYSTCPNGSIAMSILAPIVENEIKKECSKIIFSKGDMKNLYEQAKLNSKSKRSLIIREIEKNKNELQETEKKMEQIYTDKIEGIIKPEHFTKFYDIYDKRKEKILTQIDILNQELDEVANEKLMSYKEIKKIADDCLKTDCLNEELLSKIVDRIEYDGRNVKIKFNFTEHR